MKSKYFIQKGITRTILMSVFCFIYVSIISAQNNQAQINYKRIRKEAIRESLISIRPGIPGERQFWNTSSSQFIYVPSFDFKLVDGAEKYKFIAIASDSLKYSFIADKPWRDLSPVWEKMPVGFISLQVQGIDANNKSLGLAGSRMFYKAAPFQGPYHKKRIDYTGSATKALDYIFHLDHIQNWKINAVPDTSYELYCYPAKIIGAVVESMLLYSKLSPPDSSAALEIAENAADYLIRISEPKGTPLEFFPPTYVGEVLTAKEYEGQYMIIYPAEAALIYLDLYDITKKQSYLDAAVHIAETYIKLQLPSGTWKLKLWQNGTQVRNNDCIPMAMLDLFDRLGNLYKLGNYKVVRDKVFKWIMDNPVQTFNWAGQFEDVVPSEPFKNLTKHDACSFAMYLFDRVNENAKYKDIAEELLQYSEDQFVVWEKPMPQKKLKVQEWITPCALEQYSFYVPIGASASKLMATFLKAYKVTGKKLYWAKAIELANITTMAQIAETGRYPTYWEWKETRERKDWINSACYCSKVMLEMAIFIDK